MKQVLEVARAARAAGTTKSAFHTDVVSAFRRTTGVRLKPDTTYVLNRVLAEGARASTRCRDNKKRISHGRSVRLQADLCAVRLKPGHYVNLVNRVLFRGWRVAARAAGTTKSAFHTDVVSAFRRTRGPFG